MTIYRRNRTTHRQPIHAYAGRGADLTECGLQIDAWRLEDVPEDHPRLAEFLCRRCRAAMAVTARGGYRQPARPGRWRRIDAPRPKTISAAKRLTAEELDFAEELDAAPPPRRPRTRGECANGPRPCPWAGCRYHLAVEETGKGALKINWPGMDPTELEQTCALDVADRGGVTLEQAGELLNITRERIRQIESMGLARIRTTAPEALRAVVGELEE